ncbi:MAG: PRC-barrel domain-containing protein [Anaerolineae bacterium]
MLLQTKRLFGLKIRATDGDIGEVRDLYFSGDNWNVRYLVVATGPWLAGREVLLSPSSVGPPDWEDKVLPVILTREQVRHAPDVDLDRPVSGQQLEQLDVFYGWPLGMGAWTGTGTATGTPAVGGAWPAGAIMRPRRSEEMTRDLGEPEPMVEGRSVEEGEAEGDPNLRSAREVIGYSIEATDDSSGKVADLVIDDQAWAVRYLVASTGRLLPGKHVLIPREAVDRLSWGQQSVFLNIPRNKLENAPEFDRDSRLDRSIEERVYAHLGHGGYWTGDDVRVPDLEWDRAKLRR